ncbi:YggT family protein [Aquipuribacter nitratireducens]|uniref:YggT family protein n=1 Tax=Aquipuribacter nitratireducens TaxID=650104 RepID=A0ABW0GR65_9MICO
MGVVFGILAFVVFLYLILLFARLVVGWVQVFSRDWRPSGPIVVALEVVYSATDPPLNALRRVIPPLTIGSIRLDLGFMILFLVVVVLYNVLASLAASV